MLFCCGHSTLRHDIVPTPNLIQISRLMNLHPKRVWKDLLLTSWSFLRRAEQPLWSKNGLRAQGKETGSQSLRWLGGRARVMIPACGLNFPRCQRKQHPGCLSLPKYEAEGVGVRLESCQQSNIINGIILWITDFRSDFRCENRLKSYTSSPEYRYKYCLYSSSVFSKVGCMNSKCTGHSKEWRNIRISIYIFYFILFNFQFCVPFLGVSAQIIFADRHNSKSLEIRNIHTNRDRKKIKMLFLLSHTKYSTECLWQDVCGFFSHTLCNSPADTSWVSYSLIQFPRYLPRHSIRSHRLMAQSPSPKTAANFRCQSWAPGWDLCFWPTC